MIAEAIKEQIGAEIDRKKIDLRNAIKQAGEHTFTYSIYREIRAELSVKVVDEENPEGDADEASEATVPATEPDQAASDAESQPDSLLTPPLPYHERYYLRYREGKRTAALDLDGTKTFLPTK